MYAVRVSGVALVAALLGGATAAQAASRPCVRELSPAIIDPPGLRITRAEHVPAAAPPANSGSIAPLPAYCRISGTINERRGVDGKTYGIGFQIALPDKWNGRLLFQAGGGLNGIIHPPVGDLATGGRSALARGFAVVSTDSGHKGVGGFDPSFKADQQAALDFAHFSVGVTTIAAKGIARAHYGGPVRRSYIVGCSTGGREAMLASQRYPDLFDGIVVGAPAMRTGHSNIGTGHITATLNRAARKNADGTPTPLFSTADKGLILRALLNDCDGLDGLKDGVIAKTGSCKFRPSVIACHGAKTATCLTDVQVKALEAAFTPARDAAGAQIYPAFPWDTGVVVGEGGIPGILTTGLASPLGAPNTATTIDLDARLQAVRADAMQTLTDTHSWTNLSTFLDHGGKIVWYHGVSDPWFSADDTQDYYERAAAANGERFLDSSRLYMVPGAGHCGGGTNTFDQFDLLTAVVDWVETGKAPGMIPARRKTPSPAQRPLCPFPAYPHYRGGDETRIDNFECRS